MVRHRHSATAQRSASARIADARRLPTWMDGEHAQMAVALVGFDQHAADQAVRLLAQQQAAVRVGDVRGDRAHTRARTSMQMGFRRPTPRRLLAVIGLVHETRDAFRIGGVGETESAIGLHHEAAAFRFAVCFQRLAQADRYNPAFDFAPGGVDITTRPLTGQPPRWPSFCLRMRDP
jgi:hypothetical protein